MFPNFRLLVVAAFASIVMLICGFAMLAALRVGHAPLLRPLVATASPQLFADNAASRPLAFAPSEPSDRHFEIGAATGRSDAVEAFTRLLARRDHTESPPAASLGAPEPGAIAAKEQPTVLATPTEVPAAPGMPAEQSAAKSAPIANDTPIASLPAALVPLPAAETPPAVAAAAAAESTPSQPAEPTPVAATAAPPAEPDEHAAAATPAAIAAPDDDAGKNEKTKTKAHATAKSHRIRHAANDAGTQAQPTTFFTAPPVQQWQTAQTRPTKARRRSVAASKTDNIPTGIGGPFVSAPGQ